MKDLSYFLLVIIVFPSFVHLTPIQLDQCQPQESQQHLLTSDDSIVYNMSILGKTPPKGDNKSQQMYFTHQGSSNEVKDSCSEPLLQDTSIRELKKPLTSLYQEIKIEKPEKGQTDRKRSLQTPKCRCKMSRCIRYYCECFNAGLICGRDCSCHDCQNNLDNSHQLQIRQKNITKDKGCFCTKSNCQKKYCACFSSGETCKPSCKCKNCKNIPQTTNQDGEDSLLESKGHVEIKEELSGHISQPERGSNIRMEEQQFDEMDEKEKQIWDYLIEQ